MENSRKVIIALGALAAVLACICIVGGGLLFFGARVITSRVETQLMPTPVVVTQEAVQVIPDDTPSTDAPPSDVPLPAPATEAPAEPPLSVEPTTPPVAAAADDLSQVDMSVFSESWRLIQSEFDGPLPAATDLLAATVNCSVQYTLGDDAYATLQSEIEAILANSAPNTTDDQLDNLDLTAFDDAWGLVQEEYEGVLPTEEDLRATTIACSIAETLDDQFTGYTPPAVAERMREDLSGTFEGIGAFVRMNDDGILEIARPMDGQPADQAGLLAGDMIVGVDGENVIGQSQDEVISKVRGPRGTVVVLTIRREGVDAPFDVSITRARIEIPIVESEMLDGNIAYVHLTSFSRNAEAQVADALTQLLAQAPEGVIFDLRDNPGGYLDQAVAVADLFLADGIVVQERNKSGLDDVFSAGPGELAEDVPLVVLINAGSASASEIVAGAIQENGRAVIIGETSFGKGSVQLPHVLSDGSELRVTIARWYTPDNNSIDKQGIVPDIEAATPEDLNGPDDAQLQRAVEHILTGQ